MYSKGLSITKALALEGVGEILAVEPNIAKLPDSLKDVVSLVPLAEALERCNVILMLVDHDQFKSIPIDVIKNKVVIDTRGIIHKNL